MMDLLLNQNDIEIVNGDFVVCHNDIETISQSISIRLKTLAGEWFLDENIGIPYLTKVLGKKPNLAFLKQLISKEINAISGVKELSDFSFEEDAACRKITINFKAILFNQSIININESLEI